LLNMVECINRTNTKKMPMSLAESALLSTEESVMATFDFLASETVVDEEALSDGENDDGLADDDNGDDQLLVKRPSAKVILSIIIIIIIIIIITATQQFIR